MHLVCGHSERRSLAKFEIHWSINKIPPSQSHIFNEEDFTTTLEKAGGFLKAFWPPKSGTKSQPTNRSSRGQVTHKTIPSHRIQ